MHSIGEVKRIKEKISSLPKGSITKKKINGTIRYYLQYRDNKKVKSEYLKLEEVEPTQAKIEERKELEKILKCIDDYLNLPDLNNVTFKTNVLVMNDLEDFVVGVEKFQKREIFSSLMTYLKGNNEEKVCLIYGLRRTGKTTMIKQALINSDVKDFYKSAYLKMTINDTIKELNDDLKKLKHLGFKNIYIDEVTLLKDFIDTASLFSDIYAAMGMKIVLSGTDSLGFYFSIHQELYDRAIMLHTTYIPYKEHSRLLGIKDIDEYIRYGGTLKAGELLFLENEINNEDASFKDDETTRRYIDTAICKNIQHSLACYESGGHFRHLKELYLEDELTNAINRIIEDMNHEFLLDIVIKKFKSNDLHLVNNNLTKDKKYQLDLLDIISEKEVTNTLKNILDIKELNEQKVKITQDHINEIKEYLFALDLIVKSNIESISGTTPLEQIIFTQPGMRYCQAQALVYSLMKDNSFEKLDEKIKGEIVNKVLDSVKGRMLEDIVYLDIVNKVSKNQRVFKLQFIYGEFDLVIYDSIDHTCECYEIKHSKEFNSGQYKHLINEDFLQKTINKYGRITKRCVLYRGNNFISEDGIEYLNVEEFLNR